MHEFTLPAAVEPEEWTVVFHREAASRWFSLIALGRFKHVSAFAYLAGLKGWVIHDWQYGGLRVAVLPHSNESVRLLCELFPSAKTEWVKVTRRPGPSSRIGFRVGSCVGAVKHLLGLKSNALRPDALHRYLVRHEPAAVPAASERPAISAAPGASAAG